MCPTLDDRLSPEQLMPLLLNMAAACTQMGIHPGLPAWTANSSDSTAAYHRRSFSDKRL
jgi:hypothetical protein